MGAEGDSQRHLSVAHPNNYVFHLTQTIFHTDALCELQMSSSGRHIFVNKAYNALLINISLPEFDGIFWF